MTPEAYVCYTSSQLTRFGQHMTTENVRDARTKGKKSGSRKGRRPPLYAAVDLGTNNCRLLIAARRGDSFTVLDSHSQIARLGEGLEATGRMSDASIERAMDAGYEALELGKPRLRTETAGIAVCSQMAFLNDFS